MRCVHILPLADIFRARGGERRTLTELHAQNRSSTDAQYESITGTLPITANLVRDLDSGYGLVIDHYRYEADGQEVVIVGDVLPGSVAANCEQLQVEDLITSINGTSV